MAIWPDWRCGKGGCFSDADDGFDLSDNNMDGVTVGGYVGYNYRIDQVVLGLEGDANGDNAKGSSSVLGVDERALLYVTGGPSWVNTDVDTNLGIGVADVANFKSGDESTEFGWVLGAGAGYAITEHLSMKAEYLHGWYGDANLDLFEVDNGVNTTKYVLKQNLQTNVVRVGLACHFGGL